MNEELEGKESGGVSTGGVWGALTRMWSGDDDREVPEGSPGASWFGEDLTRVVQEGVERLKGTDGSSGELRGREREQDKARKDDEEEARRKWKQRQEEERKKQWEEAQLEGKRKALLTDPMHGMTKEQYELFQKKATEGRKPEEAEKAKEEALTTEFLSSGNRNVPSGLVGAYLPGLKQAHAKKEWGYGGPSLSDKEFLERGRQHYDLRDRVAAAGGVSTLFKLDPVEAREAALFHLQSTGHPGLNPKRMDSYRGWFHESMNSAEESVRTFGPEVQRALPGVSMANLFARLPDAERAVNGDIVIRDGRGGEERVLARAGANRFEIADPHAPLTKLMKASNGVPLYYPHATTRAIAEGKDLPEKKLNFFEKVLQEILPSPPPSQLQMAQGQWKPYTDLQLQRQKDEQAVLQTAEQLAKDYDALESGYQTNDQQAGTLIDEGARRAEMRAPALEDGRKRMELADKRSGLLWEAREQLLRGDISVQTYHEVGRKLGVWNVLEGPMDKAYNDDAWESSGSRMARFRAQPGMGTFADQIDELQATYRARITSLLPALKRKEPEAQAQAQMYESNYRSELASIRSAAEEKQKGIWDYMRRYLEVTDGETSIPIPDNIEGVSYKDWEAKNRQERLFKIFDAGAGVGLNTEESKRVVDTLITLQRGWDSAPGLEPEKTRVLPDGRIFVNPKYLVIPEEYKEAVMSAKASSAAKRQALEIYPELQKKAAKDLLTALEPLRDVPDIKAWFDAHPGTPEEQAAAIAREKKGDVLHQAINRVKSGGTSLAQQGTGALAILTGLVEEHTDASVGADYMHDSMLYWQNRSSAWEELAKLGDTGLLADSFTKLLGTSVSVGPPLLAGAAVTVVTRPFLAARGLQMTAMFTAATTAGAQSAASVYGDALATHLRDGVPELEARQKALDPALRAGLVTAALTYAGGPRGVEAFFRQAEGRELLKRTIWERGRAFGRHFKEEALEESTDNFLQGLNEMMSYNPGKSLDEVMKQTWEGFWMGGTLGGSMGAVRGGGGGKGASNQEGEAAQSVNGAPSADEDIWKPVTGGGIYADEEVDRGASSESTPSETTAGATGSAEIVSNRKVDPRILETFGSDVELDKYDLPVPPHPLPESDPLLQPTRDKKSAILEPDHILVQSGKLSAGVEIPRKQFHKAILQYFLDQASPVPVGQQPTVIAAGGGGGSGKSTVLKRLEAQGHLDVAGAVTVNPDDIAPLLPEFSQIKAAGDSRAAATVHSEASHLSGVLMDALLALPPGQRPHIIYDSTLAWKDSALRHFKRWRESGYQINLIGVTVDPKEAMVRAAVRAKKTGRWVPHDILAEAHAGFNSSVGDYLEYVDEARVFDNTGSDQTIIVTKDPSTGKIQIVNQQLWDTLATRGKKP